MTRMAQEANCTLADRRDRPRQRTCRTIWPRAARAAAHRSSSTKDFMAAFKLQGELMALALRCDMLRFGSMLFVGVRRPRGSPRHVQRARGPA